jgi:hypothetical protein
MFRLVVAMHLMIVTAVGPAACCCTLTRFTTKHMSSTSSGVPAPAPCCHHTPPSKGAKDDSERRPNAPGCPCKQAGGCEVIALPTALGEALESSNRAASGLFHFHLANLLDQVVLPTGGSSVFREGVGTASCTTTDNLLYAFHMLRC